MLRVNLFGVFDVCRVGPGKDIKELYTIAVAGAKAISERIQLEQLKYREVIIIHTMNEYLDLKPGAEIITFDAWGKVVHKDISFKFMRLSF